MVFLAVWLCEARLLFHVLGVLAGGLEDLELKAFIVSTGLIIKRR